MALIDSVGGLFSAASNKVGAITTVAKGIMCIPSILTGLPGIAGNLAKGVLSSLLSQGINIVGGLTNLISDTINNFIGQIAGLLNTILQIEATILATIGLIKAAIDGIVAQVKDIFEFSKDQENCRFAAAALSKCIVSSLLGGLSNKLAMDAMRSPGGIDTLISNATQKLAEPNNVILGYTGKLSNSIDKATSQINTSKLL